MKGRDGRWRRRVAAAALLSMAFPLAGTSVAEPPRSNAYEAAGGASAHIVAGLPYYDEANGGTVVILPTTASGPSAEHAVTITGHELPSMPSPIGHAISSGDVNGDGYGDIVTTTCDQTVVIPGSAQGASVDDAYTIAGNGWFQCGEVLVADLDRDGRDDVVVQSGTRRVGAVTIMWGGRRPVSPARATRVTAGTQRRFGEIMAAGNVDGDRQHELVMVSAGRIPDNDSSRRVRGVLNVCNVTRTRKVRCVEPVRTAAGARTLVVGDFVGGGVDDVVIGQPATTMVDDEHRYDRPSLWLYRGTRSGLSSPPVRLVRGKGGIPSSQGEGSSFGGRGSDWGAALATGDINGVGKDELVVGGAGDELGGSVMVLYGHRKGPGASDRDVTISQSTPGIPGSAEEPDGFGAGVSVLDMNGDGALDLGVGVPGEDDGRGAIVFIPSRDGVLDPSGSVRVEAEDIGLRPSRNPIHLGWILGR